MAHTADRVPEPQPDPDDPSGRLAGYLARTQTPLDLLALLTLWIVIVPPGDFGSGARTAAVTVRIGLSVVYGVDMAIRTVLARHHARYLRHHLLGLAVVVVPPLRVAFSVRLVRSFFQRGHLSRFLVAATVLVLNGSVAVYFYERHARGGNIHTLGDSIWWAVTTVTTVGYGDFFPVTGLGKVVASFIMGIGILTLAVVTAQVSSTFVEQAARRRAERPEAPPNPGDVTLADLAQRLARIEAHLGTDNGPGRSSA